MNVGAWLDDAYGRLLRGVDVILPNGSRMVSDGPPFRCPDCGGTGNAEHPSLSKSTPKCDTCRGLGKVRRWKFAEPKRAKPRRHRALARARRRR